MSLKLRLKVSKRDSQAGVPPPAVPPAPPQPDPSSAAPHKKRKRLAELAGGVALPVVATGPAPAVPVQKKIKLKLKCDPAAPVPAAWPCWRSSDTSILWLIVRQPTSALVLEQLRLAGHLLTTFK